MDKRWDHGFFLNEEDYIQQRIKLQAELEQLTPVSNDDLERAADLLSNFQTHWERLEGDEEARHELIKLIVERVYVQDEQVMAMTLRSNYHLVLNHKTNEPTFHKVDPFSYMDGSDGLGYLSGCSTIIWFGNLNHPALMRYLLQESVKEASIQHDLPALAVQQL